ncbi:MAG: GHKL domain-containing protein [Bacteroidetes bacterium]|nr:GHKL domain-containing protein [Bacteroidota bacterium]
MQPVIADKNIDFKLVFYTAPSLFLLLKPNSPEFTILDANDAYLKATMTKRFEIINRGLFDVFPDNPANLKANGVSNLKRSLNKVLENKQANAMPVQKYDIQVTTENGIAFEERFWNPKNIPVLNEKNEVLYIIHQVEDVTSTFNLESKMKIASAEIDEKSSLLKENEERINAILNALLRYTTMDFSEKLKITDKGDELDAVVVGLNSLIDELENQMLLLKIVNDELEYSNNELDSFSYSVSHDLRAPLRAINGYAQILIEDYGHMLDETGKHTIQVIIKNAFKMTALIDDLLTFSRIGKQGLTKVLLNMHNMIDTIVQEIKNQKQDNTIDFIIKPIEDVEGDNSMIKQVITNLISNAVKYSGKKEKAIIEIGSFKKDETLVYYIKDNGAGFDMGYYAKLFGVFQRLHSTHEFEGTGVGLALVQRIIKKHQGEVWAEAELDKGATFYFSLPTRN